MVLKDFFYIAAGYLCGSILFAPLFGSLFGQKDIVESSKDRNPGTANAFMYGGFWCGVLTLVCDIAKGFFPVFLYIRYAMPQTPSTGLALVLAAPVFGHNFSIFSGFRGGKGIATSFGCLLGLFPIAEPVVILALAFIFFSLVLRISPHYYRTIYTYLCTTVLLFCIHTREDILFGYLLIVSFIIIRMKMSSEEKDKMKVRLLWMH